MIYRRRRRRGVVATVHDPCRGRGIARNDDPRGHAAPPRPPVSADGSRPKVIDVGVNFLTKGQQKRLDALATKVEKSSGFKLRVLGGKWLAVTLGGLGRL